MANGQDEAHDAHVAEVIGKVAEALDADVFFYGGLLRLPGDREFVDLVIRECSRPNVLLVLATFGGSADSAYRIAKCLQRHYRQGKKTLFVDSFCKSAGTLIALGMDEIVMSEGAELGPLDVQVSKPDELEEWMSGLTPIQALANLRSEAFKTWEKIFLDIRRRSGGQITTRTAANISARLTTGLFAKIYEQMDPMRLGEYGLAMLIAENYGTRLAQGLKHSNLTEDALGRLIADYPTHDFVIDLEEAQTLFCRVREPTSDEQELARVLRPMLDQWLRSPARTFIECLTSVEEEGPSAEETHGEVQPGPGEVPAASGSGDGQPLGESSPGTADSSSGSSGEKDARLRGRPKGNPPRVPPRA